MNNRASTIKFKGVVELLKESWKIYFSKIKTFLGIMVVLVVFRFLSGYLTQSLSSLPFSYSIFFSFYLAAISLISLFLSWLIIPTIIYALKENLSPKDSFKKVLSIFPSFLWVFALLNLIFAGGFLLFILPGIIFSIWFSLAIFVLVFEKKKGMNALFRSQQLISGKFLGVLRRFIGFGLIILLILILIFVPIFFLFGKVKAEKISEPIGYLLELFITPFSLIYGYLIYENLAEIKKEIPYQEALIKRKLKYLLPIVLGAAFFLLIISFNFFNIFLGRDEPPIDDSDLRLSKIEIPKEENALYYLISYFHLWQPEKEALSKYWPEKIKEFKTIYWPREKKELIDKIVEGKEWNEELVQNLLKNNEQVLNDFEKAVRSPYFQDPLIQDPKTFGPETIILPLSTLRNIADLNLIKGIYLFREGKQKEAFDEIINTIRMGQLIENSPRPTAIQYLVGQAIKERSLKALRMILAETNLEPEKLKNYINKLDEFKLSEAGLINSIKMDYISFVNTKSKIDTIFRGQASIEELKKLGIEEVPVEGRAVVKLNYLYKPNQTQRLFIEYYRKAIENANKTYYNQMEFVEFEPLYPYSPIKLLFTENAVGKKMRDMIAISYSGILQRKCEEDFSIAGTSILLVLRAYQIEKGKLPNSLEELIPEYFSKIPKDSFDGKPIRYSIKKKIIYSVGKDLIDVGGSEGENWQIMPDPTFKIEF